MVNKVYPLFTCFCYAILMFLSFFLLKNLFFTWDKSWFYIYWSAIWYFLNFNMMLEVYGMVFSFLQDALWIPELFRKAKTINNLYVFKDAILVIVRLFSFVNICRFLIFLWKPFTFLRFDHFFMTNVVVSSFLIGVSMMLFPTLGLLLSWIRSFGTHFLPTFCYFFCLINVCVSLPIVSIDFFSHGQLLNSYRKFEI
jgi:hypothetical protein